MRQAGEPLVPEFSEIAPRLEPGLFDRANIRFAGLPKLPHNPRPLSAVEIGQATHVNQQL